MCQRPQGMPGVFSAVSRSSPCTPSTSEPRTMQVTAGSGCLPSKGGSRQQPLGRSPRGSQVEKVGPLFAELLNFGKWLRHPGPSLWDCRVSGGQ